jgi:hypothetical protein
LADNLKIVRHKIAGATAGGYRVEFAALAASTK